jgi:hypothetical protein
MFLELLVFRNDARRIEPMKNIARTLRAHRLHLLNYFKAEKGLPVTWSKVLTTKPK